MSPDKKIILYNQEIKPKTKQNTVMSTHKLHYNYFYDLNHFQYMIEVINDVSILVGVT